MLAERRAALAPEPDFQPGLLSRLSDGAHSLTERTRYYATSIEHEISQLRWEVAHAAALPLAAAALWLADQPPLVYAAEEPNGEPKTGFVKPEQGEEEIRKIVENLAKDIEDKNSAAISLHPWGASWVPYGFEPSPMSPELVRSIFDDAFSLGNPRCESFRVVSSDGVQVWFSGLSPEDPKGSTIGTLFIPPANVIQPISWVKFEVLTPEQFNGIRPQLATWTPCHRGQPAREPTPTSPAKEQAPSLARIQEAIAKKDYSFLASLATLPYGLLIGEYETSGSEAWRGSEIAPGIKRLLGTRKPSCDKFFYYKKDDFESLEIKVDGVTTYPGYTTTVVFGFVREDPSIRGLPFKYIAFIPTAKAQDIEDFYFKKWEPCPAARATATPRPARPAVTPEKKRVIEVGPVLFLLESGYKAFNDTEGSVGGRTPKDQVAFLDFQGQARKYDGVDGPDFVHDSPNGLEEQDGKFNPKASSCEDTGVSLDIQLQQLIKNIQFIEKHAPGVEIVLVMHSQGGVKGADLMLLMAKNPDILKAVRGFIFLQSPVRGIELDANVLERLVTGSGIKGRAIREIADELVCGLFEKDKNGIVRGLSRSVRDMIAAGNDKTRMRRLIEAAKTLERRGVFVWSAGTKNDRLLCWALLSCSNQIIPGYGEIYDTASSDHRWLVEGAGRGNDLVLEEILGSLAKHLGLKPRKESNLVRVEFPSGRVKTLPVPGLEKIAA